ncbi:MAG: Sortase family protein [candidate division WS6 bacterium OLB20]|uniref:Sortase family protein n=1 Tax=candidate division WS6 bacterium OLB20 TaxID=1617426 RepID=A0A136LZ76_9BACT|nr:MAG: Sortase family protein [candidate division WS6 bacterium OLB20]
MVRILITIVVIAVTGFTFSGVYALVSPENAIRIGASSVLAASTADTDPKITQPAVSLHFKTDVDVWEYAIEIPRIGVRKDIVANVDPSRRSVYMPVIDSYVAHGKYTRLPFEAVTEGNVYLFAHREGPSGFFNRLGELRSGDELIIRFNGDRYVYRFNHSFVVEPTRTEVYTGTSETPMLTLQTCENGNRQRLIVKADLVSVQEG